MPDVITKDLEKRFPITTRRFHKSSCGKMGAMDTLMRNIWILWHISPTSWKVFTTQLRAEFAAVHLRADPYRL
jgi:hypothetical protein